MMTTTSLTATQMILDGWFTADFDTTKVPRHAKQDESEYRINTEMISEKDFAERFVCINTSGSVLTSGTKKDGDDYKIHLSSGYSTTINEKTLKTGTVSYIILK